MGLCNEHYYATRDPLGAAGDFTTAPEISQMFGEMIGAALADSWTRAREPAEAIYVELGPGRGTLAVDALRALARAGLQPPVHFIETSRLLRAAQAARVPGALWHDSLGTLPQAPILLVANEFFDALPVRQWVSHEERRVTVEDGALMFTRDGQIREDSPAREAAAKAIAAHLDRCGGLALIIDYGHARTSDGDTLQAVRDHAFADVLTNPGEQDLTAHVDFEALGDAAEGVTVTPVVAQGEWLERLGIKARAAALGETHLERAVEIAAALGRLTASDQMGDLFKVMAIHSADWPRPAGWR